MPTLIKKKGIKSALPTNSIRFISADVWGMSVFKAMPARNAPIMASTPASSARNAAAKTTASTKMYCAAPSPCPCLKNQAPRRGNKASTINTKMANEMTSCIQNCPSRLPEVERTIIASTNNAAVSVIIVPPTATVTASFLVKPMRLIAG